MDVRFEDGVGVCHKYYGNFVRGYIGHPQKKNPIKNRVGETKKNNNGQMMKIVAYRGCGDLDVEFDDGTVIEHTCYQYFKRGRMRNSNFNRQQHVGETSTTNKGQKMTIVAYRCANDIDIQFEDGTIVKGRNYGNFKRGNIRNPKARGVERLGEEKYAYNGQRMKIIAYRSSVDIDIQFEDGTVITKRTYGNFKTGHVKNPNNLSRRYRHRSRRYR